MDVGTSLALTFAYGLFGTVQSAIMGAASRARGGREASLIMPLGAAPILAALLLLIALDEGQTKLSAPLDTALAFSGLVLLCGAVLWLTIRGLPRWVGLAGVVSIWLVLAPRLIADLGLALYVSTFTLGSCASALAFDHFGVFGTARRAVTAPRLGGLALVGVGVILVRVA
ncbi:DMT family transporter [Candidatus Amarobacter glycogenicus]|uniref:DMT family transporter n=1 Tax=Candidatus Amarobacter glycogenicus TaxID=3140699 RepID=UPI002A14E2C6|nr:DMT family transporter [Dehalococcoidia bacterium]